MKGKINWAMKSTTPMSEKEIEEHCDEVDWRAISKYQKLSDAFIIAWQERLDWYNVTLYQNLSDFVIQSVRSRLTSSPSLIKNIAVQRLGLTAEEEQCNLSIKQRWQIKRLSDKLKRRYRIGWRPIDALGKVFIGISVIGWIYYIGAKDSVSKTTLTVTTVLLTITTVIGCLLMFYRVARENLTKV